jgi:hypothetical protein
VGPRRGYSYKDGALLSGYDLVTAYGLFSLETRRASGRQPVHFPANLTILVRATWSNKGRSSASGGSGHRTIQLWLVVGLGVQTVADIAHGENPASFRSQLVSQTPDMDVDCA